MCKGFQQSALVVYPHKAPFQMASIRIINDLQSVFRLRYQVSIGRVLAQLWQVSFPLSEFFS